MSFRPDLTENVSFIKQAARQLGFDEVGMTRPASLAEGEQAIAEWVQEGRHGGMNYMENFAERRARFYEEFPDAKSVIVLGVNYYTSASASSSGGLSGRVARYAWGKDYHQVIAERHRELIEILKKKFGESFRAKSCVDTQPLPERFASVQAGLGFTGKHTGLLNKNFGPWLFLSEIVTNLELEDDIPEKGSCGTCVDCQTVCPTGALDQDYKIDARLCIAYLTIEHKGIIPRELRPKIKDWLFGCDECFAVCPFTSKSKESRWPELTASAGVGPHQDLKALFEITSNSEHEKKFLGTALLRTNRKQMLRNACVVLGNSGNPEAIPYLKKGLEDISPLVRLHAAWALGQFRTHEVLEMLLSRLTAETDPEVSGEIKSAIESAKL